MLKLQKNKNWIPTFVGMTMVFILTSCRGQKSTSPPILPIQNMVEQTSYGPQSENKLFKDKRATRAPVAGTVAEGEANEDTRLFSGKETNSTAENPQWVKTFPIKLNDDVLARGQKNYTIYCAPCHGITGHNDGLVTLRAGGTIRPADLHDDARRALPVGKIYDAVTNGVNNWNMPGFREQLSVPDRWAVVTYVRALQLSERATIKDIPENIKIEKGWNK